MTAFAADLVSRLIKLASDPSRACEVCAFRLVAEWPEAGDIHLPLDLLGNLCDGCGAWIEKQSGSFADGHLVFDPTH